MPVGRTRLHTSRFLPARAAKSCGLALLIFLFGSKALQNAIAEGETRTISMHHLHTGEDITITYKRDGRYVDSALEKIDWFLRDWRRNQAIRMDPHLIDLIWEVQRETGSKQPVDVVCGYRSPQTNAMLRRRSRGVARLSQHMLGHAMDFYIPGVPLEELRVIGLRLQRGGVGFYPTSGSPFVHMDTGGVRMWPRMTRAQLMHVFPDGRTAYIPSDGQPLPGYALALADLRKRGQNPNRTWLEEAQEGDDNATDAVADNTQPAPFKKFLTLFTGSHDENGGNGGMYTLASADTPQVAEQAAPNPQPTNALLLALEREAQRKRVAVQAAPDEQQPEAAVEPTHTKAPHVKAAHTRLRPKPVRTAAAAHREPPPPPHQTASHGMTPNQIIIARGYWQGLPDDGDATPLPAPLRNAARPGEPGAAAPDATGAIGWPGSGRDRVPPELALAYAEPPGGDLAVPASRTHSIAAAAINPVAAVPASLPTPANSTTIAVKRETDQTVSTILSASPRLSKTVPAARDLSDPWVAAIVLSPDVRRYLTTLVLGDQDLRALAPLVHKPDRTVLMTFSSDPNFGMAQDHFSGSAIVFEPTVTYAEHAALR